MEEKKKKDIFDNYDLLKLNDTINNLNCNSSINHLQDTINKINNNLPINQLQKTISILNEYNSLSNINRAIENINNYYDKVNKTISLLSSNNLAKYINDYSSMYNSIINESIKKIDNFKYQEYIELSTNILKKNIDRINEFSKIFNFAKYSIDDNEQDKELENTKLTTQIEAIPKFLSYAYANNSKVSLEEAYEKSKLKEIDDMGYKIIKRLIDINKIYSIKGNAKFHIDNCNDFGLAAVSIRDIADNEYKFKNLISMLYMGIFEFTNIKNNNIIYKLAKEYNINTIGLDLIKWFRTLEQHTSSIADEKKISEVYQFSENTINKKIPTKPSDFVKLQFAIYEKLLIMLEQIFEQLNIKENE